MKHHQSTKVKSSSDLSTKFIFDFKSLKSVNLEVPIPYAAVST